MDGLVCTCKTAPFGAFPCFGLLVTEELMQIPRCSANENDLPSLETFLHFYPPQLVMFLKGMDCSSSDRGWNSEAFSLWGPEKHEAVT